MSERQPWEPNLFPPGEEPDWVVGYEMTDNGWRALSAADEEALMRESEAELDRGEGIPHEEVMASVHALLDELRAAAAK